MIDGAAGLIGGAAIAYVLIAMIGKGVSLMSVDNPFYAKTIDFIGGSCIEYEHNKHCSQIDVLSCVGMKLSISFICSRYRLSSTSS